MTHLVKDEAKGIEAAVSKVLQEESKQQENESNSVHEEETKVEEPGDAEEQKVGYIKCTFFSSCNKFY